MSKVKGHGLLILDYKTENEYTFLGEPESLDKVWISFGKFSISIHKTDEGVVVDVFQKGKEDRGDLASCYAFDSEILTDKEYEKECKNLERERILSDAGRTD
jgi:hypothetical protein